MPVPDKHLPPLPFGAAAAQSFDSVQTLGDALAPFVGGLQAVESAASPTALRSRVSGVNVADVSLMACATTPGRAIIGANDQLVFGFARSGRVSYVTASQTFRGVQEDHFLVADSCPRTVVTDRETMLVVMVVDRQRLLRTADTMLATSTAGRVRHSPEALLPRQGALLPIDNPLVASGTALSGIFHMIDAVQCDASALAVLAIDDHVHRLLVMMLAPRQLISGPGRGDGTRGAEGAVEMACEFIEAHLPGPITLTRLEEVTGLGARALQLAFQKHHACSPTEWILRRRLERVRLVLLSGADNVSIRDAARQHGFLQAGHFARMYRRQFGERPSETRARSRG